MRSFICHNSDASQARESRPAKWVILAAVAFAGGCWTTLRPDPEQVKAWVRQEIPIGSSESDVEQFSANHHFIYERSRNDRSYAQAYRAMEGCDWEQPIVQVELEYGENNQVKSATVRAFSTGLP